MKTATRSAERLDVVPAPNVGLGMVTFGLGGLIGLWFALEPAYNGIRALAGWQPLPSGLTWGGVIFYVVGGSLLALAIAAYGGAQLTTVFGPDALTRWTIFGSKRLKWGDATRIYLERVKSSRVLCIESPAYTAKMPTWLYRDPDAVIAFLRCVCSRASFDLE